MTATARQLLASSRYGKRRRTPGMTSRLASEHIEHGPGWVSVVVPVKTVSLTNIREHWAAKARRAKAERVAGDLAMRSAVVRYGSVFLSVPSAITLTRLAPRRLDTGNAAASMKHVQDGVCDRLGIDDGDPRIEWRYGQERGPYGVRVRIEWITQPKSKGAA